MTKKGLFVTLMTVTFAFFRASSYANAPVITDPGDVVIGDLEQGANNNVFVFPDAINLDTIVTDDNNLPASIKWSYTSSGTQVTINGVPKLDIPGGDDPTNPPSPARVDGNDNDTILRPPNATQDTSARTITFRNENYSPIATNGGLGPYADPGTTAPAILEQEMITLYASDCTTYSFQTITVYTSDNTSDSISGGIQLTLIRDDNFDADPSLIAGWFGGALGGATALATTGTATGLCMWVGSTQPATAVNAGAGAGWISPPNFTSGGPTASTGFITLVDKTVYRIRLTMWTDETAVGAIPFWTFGYNNLNGTGVGAPGNTYGGDLWALDVAGGANGINDPTVNGRPSGRVTFDYWFTPDAMLADQWRGTLPGGGSNPDNANSAFDPSVDTINDMNLIIRILDSAQGANTIHNEVDQGTICVKELRIDSIDYDTLITRASPAFVHPITTSEFYIDPDTFSGGGTGTATIDNTSNSATFRMGPNYTGTVGSNTYKGGRKSLKYYDPSLIFTDGSGGQNYNLAGYPVAWNDNQLLQLRVGIKSGVGGGTGTVEGTDPVDTIFINWITPTSEIGGFNFTQIGAATDMLRAASPRLAANTTSGTSQIYTAFFWSQNSTVIDPIANPTFEQAKRITAYPDFINNASLGGSATNGLDAFIIDSYGIYTIDTTGFN